MEEGVERTKLANLIFDKEEMQRVKDVILRYYVNLKDIFAYYAANSPDYPRVNYDDVYQVMLRPLVGEDDYLEKMQSIFN